MSKKNELTNSQETAVATTDNEAMDAWGQSAISSKDIVIPKILCMQGLSELVSDDNHPAKMGDFVDSLSTEILGNYKDTPIEFIPFHLEKLWAVSKRSVGDTNYEFEKFEEVTVANEGRQYNETIGDLEYKYEYTMRFYCLLPNDTSLPYIISFKGTSTRAGKVLATQMYVKNRAAGLVPPAYVMRLAGTKDKNDKGTFIVMNVASVRKAEQSQINEAFGWFKTITSGGAKVHDADEQTASASEPQQEMF